MSVRRETDPIIVQEIWNAIKNVDEIKTADKQTIVKYLQKSIGCSESQGESYIDSAVKDLLILETVKANGKISSYKTTTHNPILDGHDWYCFECHKPGLVYECKKCSRVFHPDCVPFAKEIYKDLLNLTSILSKNNNNNRIRNNDSNILTREQQTNEHYINGMNDSCLAIAQPNANSTMRESSVNTEKKNDEEREGIDVLKMDAMIENAAPFDGNNTTSIIDDDREKIKMREFDVKLCRVCNMLKLEDGVSWKLTKNELNSLLLFVLNRIRSWFPGTITSKLTLTISANSNTSNDNNEVENSLTDSELTWRVKQLLYEEIDLSILEEKLKSFHYTNTNNFFGDVLGIQHNIVILHGDDSYESKSAELMIQDCYHDLNEMRLCVDCYRHSNEKINSNWFCLPCSEPHELVWAKQKGYPYWPAKVISENNGINKFDVRFFGGKHERSQLPKSCIKPISTPKDKLPKTKSTTVAFIKAVEELELHQRVLNNPSELETLLISQKKSSTSKINLKRSVNKQKSGKNSKTVVNKITDSPNLEIKKQKKTKESSKIINNSSNNKSGDIYDFDDSQSEHIMLQVTYGGSKKRSLSNMEDDDDDDDDSGNEKKRMDTENYTEEEIRKQKRRLPSLQQIEGENSTQKSNNDKTVNVSDSVINISDVDDDNDDNNERFLSREKDILNNSDSIEMVTSSTEVIMDKGAQKNNENHAFSDKVEKLYRDLEPINDKKELVKIAMNSMQNIIDDHDEQLKRLFESHNSQISDIKKKQWCYNCEQEAIYHCCWNSAYCSQSCQQQHWLAEHKKVCRRKR